MRVISRKKLTAYGAENPDAKSALDSWYSEAKNSTWKMPSDIKEKYRSASILKQGRVVFNIAGNKFRLIVWINFEREIVYIKFVGTHEDYDKINAEDVTHD